MSVGAQYCEIYLQGLYQIPTENTRKITLGFLQGEGERKHSETLKSTLFLTRSALERNRLPRT